VDILIGPHQPGNAPCPHRAQDTTRPPAREHHPRDRHRGSRGHRRGRRVHPHHDWAAHHGQTGWLAWAEQLQHWETYIDPNWQQLPRAKRHDDKSIAAIQFDA
jgi:hypothetical protein